MDRRYSLLEVYATGGGLAEIYVNVSSPADIDGAQLRFTDYQPDVSRKPPHAAVLADEEEFLEAAARYGYSEESQQTCYEVAGEAIEVANSSSPGKCQKAEFDPRMKPSARACRRGV